MKKGTQYLYKEVLLASLAFFCLSGFSMPPPKTDSVLVVNNQKDFFPLNLGSFLLKDNRGLFNLDSAIKHDNLFVPIRQEMYGLRQDGNCKAYWLRCKVYNETSLVLNQLVCLQPGVDSVDLFVIDPQGLLLHSSIASAQKTRSRYFFISRELALPVKLPPGTTTLYVRLLNASIWSRERANIMLSLADENSFVNYFLESRFYQGVALGMIFLILILHIFMYVFFRDFTYLVYLINILLTLTYLLLRKHFQLELDFLSPAFSYLPYLHDPIDFMLTLTAVWFCQLFLNTRDEDLILHRVMDGIKIALIVACLCAISLRFLELVNWLSIYIGLAAGVSLVVASIRSLRRGNRFALYVFGGFVPLMIAVVIYIFPGPDYLHFRSNEADVHYYAEAIRAIIFSVGIADRFYQLKKESLRSKIEQEKLRFEQEKKIQQEKERISRDLHDNIGSQLAVLSLELGNLSNEHDQDLKITAAQQSAHQIINELRDTVWAIENNQVTIDDFENKLNALLLSFRKRITSINFKLEIPDTIKTLTLKPSQAINLYRVIQEAMQNAIKHSKANQVKIIFTEPAKNKVLTVSIQDNGVGFQNDTDREFPVDHYGIKNMKKRADEINGYLTISTQPGETNITLSFPVTHDVVRGSFRS